MANIIKKAKSVSPFLKSHKKQVLTTGITVIACLLVIGVANTGNSIFASMETEASEAYVSLQNEKENFRRSDRYFTNQEERLQGDEVELRYEGDQVDGGRWSADEEFFWDFIEPAFNYNSGTEYNQTRASYEAKLGKCLFTTQFMTVYDIDAQALAIRANNGDKRTGEITEAERSQADHAFKCTALKSDLLTFPTGVDANGDYSYISFVGMGRNGKTDSTILVAFTYTIRRADGAEPSIINFSCWPPHSRNPLSNQTLRMR